MKIYHHLTTAFLVLALASCAAPTGGTTTNNPPAASGHDGTQASPVLLVLNASPVSGKVGNTDSFSENLSYYQFNSGTETSVLFSVTASSLAQVNTGAYQVRIYSDAALQNQITNGVHTVDDNTAPLITGLSTGTTYYVTVWNQKVSANLTYQIGVKTVPTTLNEGVGSPVPLTLGTNRTSFTTNLSGGVSRYTFNTGTLTSVTSSYEMDVLGATVYSNADFSSGFQDWEFSGVGGNTLGLTGLQTGTDYYLEIENRGSLGTVQISYMLRVE